MLKISLIKLSFPDDLQHFKPFITSANSFTDMEACSPSNKAFISQSVYKKKTIHSLFLWHLNF